MDETSWDVEVIELPKPAQKRAKKDDTEGAKPTKKATAAKSKSKAGVAASQRSDEDDDDDDSDFIENPEAIKPATPKGKKSAAATPKKGKASFVVPLHSSTRTQSGVHSAWDGTFFGLARPAPAAVTIWLHPACTGA